MLTFNFVQVRQLRALSANCTQVRQIARSFGNCAQVRQLHAGSAIARRFGNCTQVRQIARSFGNLRAGSAIACTFMQLHAESQNYSKSFYSFSRLAWDQSETLQNGIGAPALHCGLSRSPFRPSDDSHRLPFPVAANAMMSVSMKKIYEMLHNDASCRDEKLVNTTRELYREIERAVWEHGVVHHPHVGRIFAFEVDGYGSFYAIDDANIPSVLSLPYLGFIKAKDETYDRTRKFLFSDKNPFYFKGTKGRGIGSQHTGIDYIWPLSIIMQATTSENDAEIKECLELLKSTDNGTGFMHESFYKNDPSKFTRTWFAWANAQFGHLILKIAKERPYLIFGNQPN